jgi:hypothetical protein
MLAMTETATLERIAVERGTVFVFFCFGVVE